MGQGLLIGGLGCFLWGMVSVLFSPCHLASIPLIVSYVAAQDQNVEERKAALYSLVFTIGLFITIAIIGFICTILGRMLGDVGPYMSILVGVVLVWVALDFLGLASCSLSGGMMAKIKVRGIFGAFVLGLAYGVLSGSCTFFYCSDSGHYNSSTKNHNGNHVYYPFWPGALYSYCRGGKFHSFCKETFGQQQLVYGEYSF